jgi:hypothetical protein
MDLSYITNRYFPKLSPADINGGSCYHWAYRVFKLYPESRLWSTSMWGGHAWIEIANRYYDAEHPTGTTKLGDIVPAVANYQENNAWVQNNVQQMSEQAFRRFWRLRGPKSVSRIS